MEKINRIKEILARYDKTQQWLAKQIGKSYSRMNDYCNNRRQPSLHDLKKMAEVLDVDIKDLLVSTKEEEK